MSANKACCSLPPVVSDYQPKGSIEKIDDLSVYFVGPKDAKKAVVVIYDIFGFHPNTKQFCDILGEKFNFRVALPDFFRGKPWDHTRMTPEDRPALMQWITSVGSWDNTKPDLEKVKKHLSSSGSTDFGVVGFCWGAKMGVLATRDGSFSAASLIHPSLLADEDAELAEAPILLIPSKDEPDLTKFVEILKKKSFGSKCSYHLFDDMHHGFAAARGDYNDPANVKRTTEAIQLTGDFFQNNV
ncbi:alpha/beta-hydrolase [Basidiobolus meristosporus CBS 931.73]|uniref:Alpha/beta-hydrolase n=1 Tax=Basidiobolus meristosporus CBS 931.73 TaxID=1314790 RepID=A0A1Y1Y5T6_9FUNG|nr:alpha/beta-hydrolase [Basidiobolus meristosporus CBS 931.73]|eukprot:ORX93391.1 alpha/beta-hydrolase [Basidiobolus meristosporus CBS 931.73]